MIGWNKTKTAELLLVVIVTLAILIGLSEAVKLIDITIFPEQIQPAISIFIVFMGSGTMLFVVGFGRNVLGFLRNYFKTHHKEDYDINRLYSTWFYYYGILGTTIAFVKTVVPPIYADPIVAIMTAVAVVLDFVLSEINKLRSPQLPPIITVKS